MKVVIVNRQQTRKINLRLLKKITGGLLAGLEIENAELGVNLVAETEMILLNETFLRHRGPTDVITFDYSSAERGVRSAESRLHGEIFVCVDEAIRQAKKFGATWQLEIVRYIIHGVLHLLGHDDSRPAARRKMKREENRWLSRLSRRFSLAQLARATKLGA